MRISLSWLIHFIAFLNIAYFTKREYRIKEYFEGSDDWIFCSNLLTKFEADSRWSKWYYSDRYENIKIKIVKCK